MTTVQVSLPDPMKAFLESQVEKQGFDSIESYLRALIRDAQAHQAKGDIASKLREAIEDGPAEPLTPEDWQDLENRVWEEHRQEQANR